MSHPRNHEFVQGSVPDSNSSTSRYSNYPEGEQVNPLERSSTCDTSKKRGNPAKPLQLLHLHLPKPQDVWAPKTAQTGPVCRCGCGIALSGRSRQQAPFIHTLHPCFLWIDTPAPTNPQTVLELRLFSFGTPEPKDAERLKRGVGGTRPPAMRPTAGRI